MQIDLESIYSFHQMGERSNQEDSRFPDDDAPGVGNAVFAVCDGVGGCEKGEVASTTVCRTIGKLLSSHSKADSFTVEDFKVVLKSAYDALDKVSNNSNKGMGTTLTFVCFHADGVLAAHIGDSRIYQIRPHEGIIYRSEDHSLVNALLRSGNISPEQVKDHPKNNVITRCMSADDGIRGKDDATVVNLQDIVTGDYFLLCSDGVTNCIEDDELIDLYTSEMSDKEKYEWLSVRCRNSSDNNTAIQIHVGLVTVDVESDDDEADVTNEYVVNTRKLNKKNNTVHDISVIEDKSGISKIKSLIKAIFR